MGQGSLDKQSVLEGPELRVRLYPINKVSVCFALTVSSVDVGNEYVGCNVLLRGDNSDTGVDALDRRTLDRFRCPCPERQGDCESVRLAAHAWVAIGEETVGCGNPLLELHECGAVDSLEETVISNKVTADKPQTVGSVDAVPEFSLYVVGFYVELVKGSVASQCRATPSL